MHPPLRVSALPTCCPPLLLCRQVPRHEIPPAIGDMTITPELLDDYAGAW